MKRHGIFGCFGLILDRSDPIYHVQRHLLRAPGDPVQYPQRQWVQNFILEGVCQEPESDRSENYLKFPQLKIKIFSTQFSGVFLLINSLILISSQKQFLTQRTGFWPKNSNSATPTRPDWPFQVTHQKSLKMVKNRQKCGFSRFDGLMW